MKRILTAMLLAGTLALGGCASGGGFPKLSITNPVTTNDIVTVKAAYGAALAVAAEYRDLYDRNRCTVSRPESLTNICARRSVVVRMQNAAKVANIAINNADWFIRTNPTLDPTSVISAARAAVSTFRQITETKQ